MHRTAHLIYKNFYGIDNSATILENCCSFLLKTNGLSFLQSLFWLSEQLSNALSSTLPVFLKIYLSGGDSSSIE